MGALFSPPSPPAVQPVPPAAIPPTIANPAVSLAGQAQRAKSATAGAGFDGTLTNTGGAAGVVPGPGQTAGRQLLG